MKQRLIYLVPFVLAIFLCACSSSTPASTGSASGNGSTATETSNSGTTDTGNKTSNTSAEKPKGLLIGNLKIGKAYSYKSTGTLSCITFTMKLDLIDPDTGEVTDFRTFSSEETRSCTASCPYVGGSTTEVMRNFDSSFTKMTATLDMEDGASHVGWIDESGAFTDVSEKVAASSSFGGLTKHGSPAFVDDYFYYFDNTDGGEAKRVPIDNLSPDAVETIADNISGAMVIRVDGSIAENSLTTNEYYDSSMKYAANTSVFTDWIGVNDCIGMDNEGMLYRYTLNDDQSDLLFHWYSNRTELVPYVKGRYNWSGVVSPEKDCVAFLSRVSSDSTGRNSTVGLFLVDLQGGDPQAIDCSYTFPTDFSAVAQQENKVGILGWF